MVLCTQLQGLHAEECARRQPVHWKSFSCDSPRNSWKGRSIRIYNFQENEKSMSGRVRGRDTKKKKKKSLELEHPQSSPLNRGGGKRHDCTSFSLKKRPVLEAAVPGAFLPQPCLLLKDEHLKKECVRGVGMGEGGRGG